MGIEWFRWFHGAVADDKWPLVARRSGQSVAVVVAVWAALLECASQAGERGSVEAFDPESLDALLHLPDGTCQAVFDALCEGRKPRIVNGRVARWTVRQPEREDPGAAARKRIQREREKEKGEGAACAVPPCHAASRAGAYGCDAACPVLAGHETGRQTAGPVTPDKKRADKKRQEKIKEEFPAMPVPGHAGPLRSRSGAAEEADVSVPFVAGNAAAAAARAEALTAGGSSHGAADLEFQELRVFYDEHARAEAPKAGNAEYRQCRAARIWPGLDVVCRAITALSATDAQWKNGFAPGLARFLREQHWRKQPAAGRGGSRRAGDGAVDPITAKNMQAAARVLARRQGGAL